MRATFNGRLRDECLNGEVFFNLTDAREKLERWRRDYNHTRPHSALADRTPIEFASVAERRPFPLRSVDKADPRPHQGSAVAGQKSPALDPVTDLPCGSEMRGKDLNESPGLMERLN